MYGPVVLFLLQCAVVLCYVHTKPATKCYVRDTECNTKLGRYIISATISGNEALGIQPLDPMYQDSMEGEVEKIKYTLTDSIITGHNDMIVNEVKFVPDKYFQFNFTFPHYEQSGFLDFSGKLGYNPVHGKGKYSINMTKINMQVNSTRILYYKDGQKYAKFIDIQTNLELLGYMKLSPESDEDQILTLVQFFNENPDMVLSTWQKPIGDANMNKLFKNINILLSTIPVDDIAYTTSSTYN